MAYLCGCPISAGFTADCLTLKQAGGLYNYLYVFNICDLNDATPLTIDVNGYVTNFTFKADKGFYKFVSKNDSFASGYEGVRAEGTSYFNHRVEGRVYSKTPVTDKVLEDLLVASVGVISITSNEEVLLYGWRKGMRIETLTQTSGFTAGDNAADNFTLVGDSLKKPLRVKDTDFPTTLAMLEAKLAA